MSARPLPLYKKRRELACYTHCHPCWTGRTRTGSFSTGPETEPSVQSSDSSSLPANTGAGLTLGNINAFSGIPSSPEADTPVTMAAIGSRGTVTEFRGFNADEDAQKLRKGMKGVGTDESAIIEVLAKRTIAQRQLIKQAFKKAVGKDLLDELKGELTGNFEKVVLGLLMPSPVYSAYELRNAIKGAGTDEGCLIDILASQNNQEMRAIIAAYKNEYGKDLEEDVCSDTSGMFQRVLVSLLTANRDESDRVDQAQAVQDAKDMYEAGEARWGTDEVKFLTVLCIRNRQHLLRVFEEYQKISNRDIEESIKREMSGNLEDAFLAIVKCLRNKPAFFAERLYKSMKGLGTTDSILIRVMVSRCEIDMLDIKAQFQKMYGKTLYSFIKGDCSGDYRNILLQLCGSDS